MHICVKNRFRYLNSWKSIFLQNDLVIILAFLLFRDYFTNTVKRKTTIGIRSLMFLTGLPDFKGLVASL